MIRPFGKEKTLEELEAEKAYKEKIRLAGEKQDDYGYWKKIYPDGRFPE